MYARRAARDRAHAARRPVEGRLRRALCDPAALIDDEATARARYVLRSHVLESLDQAVQTISAPVMLVKGAALALTVYPRPWQRDMADIDLLVGPTDRACVLEALDRAGCRVLPAPPGRPWSVAALDETPLAVEFGRAGVLVELHTGLDKIVSRPVQYAEIFARACPVPGLHTLREPSPEDHALLVVLHAATSGFRHPVGLVDLELLLRRGLDLDALARRARRWKLRTALYVALGALHAHGSPTVSSQLVARFRPGAVRRRVVATVYRPDGHPAVPWLQRLGWPWVLGQTPLRDDLGRWVVGLGSYAVVRAAERSAAWVGQAGRLTGQRRAD